MSKEEKKQMQQAKKQAKILTVLKKAWNALLLVEEPIYHPPFNQVFKQNDWETRCDMSHCLPWGSKDETYALYDNPTCFRKKRRTK